jgi:hypothetical protein
MNKVLALAVSFCLLGASTGVSKEIAGVSLPDTTVVDGKTLKLNGEGLRTKVVFKVYVAGLYLESPTRDAATVISSDQVKRIHLSILRTLSSRQVTEAIQEGFEKNSGSHMSALSTRLANLAGMIPNVEKGDQIVLTYVPGRGTVVAAKGQEKGVIIGKDFADALFSVWLGPSPVQADLKTALLGG